ncbi:RNA polymerase sigma-70 factor [Flavobacterium sp. MC2016-06]|uniref:RNA polymerase sigma factor n=1 Tax=Flavobacterium sp. MC2016-06 TaxID=2676308 RepID=UPI0012BAE038|nr:RNA polymerase sigma-70 factor [Flavobacterium sp. MC2016-06]MBU3859503.1 RNA polymerase sigma-70 factor [Flavobacterium sp. MC2016-06]
MLEATDYNEKILVSELKNNCEKAFRKLFDLYYQDIYGYSVSLLKSKEAAEENVQDVFMKVWQHRENLNIEQSFKAYIFTIARNQAFNVLNKAANDIELKEAVFYESQKSHEYGDYSIREADCKKLRKQAIRQLPPKRKQIFKMSRKKGMTYEEISQELGISINTVRNQMSKALETMRVFFHLHDEII